ncbi:MAG: dihydroorotase [Planctomycetota bacterium]
MIPNPTRVLIRGGRLIDPASGVDSVSDLAIVDGRVAEIGSGLDAAPATEVIDAEGLLVLPGLVDPHVHLREPGGEHKETIASGSAAAAAGGFTTVAAMPNTSPAIDHPAMVRFVEQRGREAGRCRVRVVGAATPGRRGERAADIRSMRSAGAVAFSDDGDVIASAGVMSAVLGAVHQAGAVFMQHCQEPTLTPNAAMHAGEISVRMGVPGWPRAAEEVIVERDLRLNRGIGCRYHAQHLSSAGSIDLIRSARARGEPVTGEASPHHLHLTDEICLSEDGHGLNTLGKVNPPVREASDVRALRQAVADGVVTILGTDHAPHAAHEKALPFEEAPFGMIGLEFAVPLYAEALVESGAIGWPRLVELLTVEPTRLLGLEDEGVGRLRVGDAADVTLYDPAHEWTIEPDALSGRSANTPFLGRSVRGRAIKTLLAGAVVSDRLAERA